MASDPGLKQSTCSLWDTITRESEAPAIGASSAMKYMFCPTYKHIWGVLIELYQFMAQLIDFGFFCSRIWYKCQFKQLECNVDVFA